MKIDYTGLRASLPHIDEAASVQKASQVRGEASEDLFRLTLAQETEKAPLTVNGTGESERVRNEPQKEREKKRRTGQRRRDGGTIDVLC
ncbi:MAG TPA: hypothetical protein GX507_03955 [Clostridia bacterium]|nr:hypothetical protein [Clostridia bacterium]